MSDAAPLLSVVVTVVGGGEDLRRCLAALLAQADPPSLEILVPCDSSVAGILELGAEFPAVQFIGLGVLPTLHPPQSAAGQHELYDRRRAAGLAAAGGQLVAILEDRAPPRPDWARTMARLHRELPHAVIGGAIECAAPDPLNRAFHLCDFERYSLPFESGPRAWISDINVCYKRRGLDATREIWRERFHEPLVHWSLRDRGETLYLSREPVVDYRTSYPSLRAALPERFQWGRLFGRLRAARLSRPRRLGYLLLGPVLPVVLFARHGRAQWRKRKLSRFLPAAPPLLVLLTAWAFGEAWGCLTGKS